MDKSIRYGRILSVVGVETQSWWWFLGVKSDSVKLIQLRWEGKALEEPEQLENPEVVEI